MKRTASSFARWIAAHKRQILITVGVLLVIIIAVQLIYPSKNLLPFARIDNLSVGGWKKKDATYELNARLNKVAMPIIVSGADNTYATVLPEDIGLNIDNEKRVNAQSYPLWARLMPTSIIWYQHFQSDSKPQYNRDETKAEIYIEDALGSCDLAPKNASLVFKNDKLEVVSAKDGGTCDSKNVMSKLSSVEPTLSMPTTIMLDVKISKPKVDDSQAKKFKEEIENQAGKQIDLKVGQETQSIPSKTVFSWLSFEAKKDNLAFNIDIKKSNEYFAKTIAKKVTVPAGITKVKTRDFTELSRVNGKNGVALNGDATRASLKKVLEGGAELAQASTVTLKPKVEYDRSYTKTSIGISALVAQYGQDHSGTFGVAFRELGGQGRQASYNDTSKFITASTYKLFVAYGTLKKVEAKKWKWSDNITGGRDLAQCFDDMIVKSDNACAEALYEKIGYQKTIDDVRKLGLPNTILDSEAQKTSAGDLATFLTKLQTGSIGLEDSSRERLLDAMKRNQYRQGIPSGTNGTVANKVGFLSGLLHDAAIVNSSKGDYVLVIMTDGSSWANIADLTKKIESLR